MIVGRIQFLVGCWTENLNFLMVLGRGLWSVPFQMVLFNMAACRCKHAGRIGNRGSLLVRCNPQSLKLIHFPGPFPYSIG